MRDLTRPGPKTRRIIEHPLQADTKGDSLFVRVGRGEGGEGGRGGEPLIGGHTLEASPLLGAAQASAGSGPWITPAAPVAGRPPSRLALNPPSRATVEEIYLTSTMP